MSSHDSNLQVNQSYFATRVAVLREHVTMCFIMTTLVDTSTVIAAAIYVSAVLVSVSAGLVIYIIKRLTRGYDQMATELTELKADHADSKGRAASGIEALRDRHLDLINIIDGKFVDMRDRSSALEHLYGELNRNQAELLRSQSELSNHVTAEMLKHQAGFSRDIDELRAGLGELRERLAEMN